MKKKSKIVFFGNEKLATGLVDIKPLIQKTVENTGFEIEQHITGPLSTLRPHEAEIAVLAAYGHIIPQVVLDEFPLGIINVHPSLLPSYRGSTPIEQAILDGATKSGVSIMQLTDKMDEGPIYKQKTVHLSGHETKTDLAHDLQRLGAELLVDVLHDIASGKLKPRQQPHPDRATYTKRITKGNGQIDWNKPASQIEREIRAYAGWPNSRTTLGDNLEVVIHKADVIESSESTPGKILASKDSITIVCGVQALQIISLQPSNKSVMETLAFINGYRDRLGAQAA